MIPEEDLGPSWLRDYGDIEADIRQMREFATRLEAEVRRNYAPHLAYIADDMSVKLPDPCDAFIELVHFLTAHQQVQQDSTNRVYDVASYTGGLANAAGTISQRYEGSDAFAQARVQDVERALRGVQGPVRGDQPSGPPTVPDPAGAPTTPEVLP
ncbi:hypothetical protein [Micromonospora sagamiensis]|uniref:Uncharacterized protein n=1 Tax=Micromonospora sagamiensis TaxID=47875 RepID=A0A562WPH4_9ACTN|nr:hypothetical protein [Micromonospora sagamiensis]TWJ31314.1 hypothetical protein JD81_04869 [Micromonospora sagamiensis]BCL15641.1 hypothetical protein GCM10017556_33800 [Micromonospora sagamiensis]